MNDKKNSLDQSFSSKISALSSDYLYLTFYRRSYAARHKRLIKEEYANHKSEKLRPIDLLALRPKTYKYQVLSQIPSQAPHTEIDEFGLHKHVVCAYHIVYTCILAEV